jgi:hypothetical protein
MLSCSGHLTWIVLRLIAETWHLQGCLLEVKLSLWVIEHISGALHVWLSNVYRGMKSLQVQTVVVYVGTFCCMLQDLKLNMLLAESLPLLAQLLHQLACDLQLQEYVLHYWKDFPFHCPLVTCSLVRNVGCCPWIAFSILGFPIHVFSTTSQLLLKLIITVVSDLCSVITF